VCHLHHFQLDSFHNHDTRSRNNLHLARCKTSYGLKCIKYKGSNLWNKWGIKFWINMLGAGLRSPSAFPVIIIFIILFTVIGYSYHRWPAVMEFSFLAACRCVKLLLYWLWLIWQINCTLSLFFFLPSLSLVTCRVFILCVANIVSCRNNPSLLPRYFIYNLFLVFIVFFLPQANNHLSHTFELLQNLLELTLVLSANPTTFSSIMSLKIAMTKQ